MREIDATRLKLKALEMVEGTELSWCEVIKYRGNHLTIRYAFDGNAEDYELALGIVDGKPVFRGDKGWSRSLGREVVMSLDNLNSTGNWNYMDVLAIYPYDDFAWENPKPKTMMVELTTEAVSYWKLVGDLWSGNGGIPGDEKYKAHAIEFYEACREALEKLK